MPSRFSYSARFRRRSIRPRRTDLLERKPVYYIYPGLIRMSGRRAVTIDSNCPASLYGTEHQRVDNLPSVTSCPSSSSPSISTATQHSPDTCAICLEPFRQSKDIIRQLPCNHFFHSKCRLPFFPFLCSKFPFQYILYRCACLIISTPLNASQRLSTRIILILTLSISHFKFCLLSNSCRRLCLVYLRHTDMKVS